MYVAWSVGAFLYTTMNTSCGSEDYVWDRHAFEGFYLSIVSFSLFKILYPGYNRYNFLRPVSLVIL